MAACRLKNGPLDIADCLHVQLRALPATLNDWTLERAQITTERAMELWHKRSRQQWTSDASYATRAYGVIISEEAGKRADTANSRLIKKAWLHHHGAASRKRS